MEAVETAETHQEQVNRILFRWQEKMYVLNRGYHDGENGIRMKDAVQVLQSCAREIGQISQQA